MHRSILKHVHSSARIHHSVSAMIVNLSHPCKRMDTEFAKVINFGEWWEVVGIYKIRFIILLVNIGHEM